MGVMKKAGIAFATVAASAALAAPAAASGGGGGATIEIRDACDPVTFAFVPGGCNRVDDSGGTVTFDELFATLVEKGEHGAWAFKPEETTIRAGETVTGAIERGGEVHTFTPVAAFGPGCVPEINEILFHSPATGPDCAQFDATIVIPGVRPSISFTPAKGTQRYMCLIHPWMQTTVKVR
jgi:plastocyanin